MDQYKPGAIVWFGCCLWNEQGKPYVEVRRGKIIKRDKSFVTEPWYGIKFDDASRKLVPAKRLSDTELDAYKSVIRQMQEDIDDLDKQILAEQSERFKLYVLLAQTEREIGRKERGDPE